MDKLIIIDVESTCWTESHMRDQGEIIEIGVCLLDSDTFEVSDKRSLIVKPRHSTVSAFCTNLTTLTQNDVDNGMSLEDACRILETEFQSRTRPWESYGNYDKNMFLRETERKKVRYPFSNRHMNIKQLFAQEFGLSREVGMAKALQILKLPLVGTHHRGDSDSWNIAQIRIKIFQKIRSIK